MTKVFKQIKSFGLVVISGGLIAVLLMGSVVPSQAAPAKEIVVGYRSGFTGPLASTLVPFTTGGIDCARYYNDYEGGINGIPIKFMWEDNHSEATKEISIHKRFVAAGAVLEISYMSGSAMYTVALQQRDEVPLVSVEIDEGTRTEPHWVWGVVPPWNSMHATVIKWVKETWTETRPPKVGMVGINQPISYTAIEGIPEFCGRNSVEWVGYEIVPLFGCIDTSVELLRLAAKKPDLVYVVVYGASLVTVMKDAARLELQEKGIRFVGSANSVDKVICDAAGWDSAEGWYVLRATPNAWEDEVAGVKATAMPKIRESGKRYRDREPEEIAEFYAGGWGCASVAFEGVRIALEKVGIEDLTGRAVRDGLFSIKDYETGFTPFRVTVTEDKPYFTDAFLLYRVQQGKVTPAPEAPLMTMVLPIELGTIL